MLFSFCSYQRAKLLHRTAADRTKLLKKVSKARKKMDTRLESDIGQPVSAKSVCVQQARLFQPRVMKAFEKDLKKKTKSSKPWDFSTYYNGNLLHVSVNSDSDNSETSFDSLDNET